MLARAFWPTEWAPYEKPLGPDPGLPPIRVMGRNEPHDLSEPRHYGVGVRGWKELESAKHSRHFRMGIAVINCLLVDKTQALASDLGSVISLLCGFRKVTV